MDFNASVSTMKVLRCSTWIGRWIQATLMGSDVPTDLRRSTTLRGPRTSVFFVYAGSLGLPLYYSGTRNASSPLLLSLSSSLEHFHLLQITAKVSEEPFSIHQTVI